MTRIILASQSPRRKSLLQRMNIGEFETIPSGFEENLDESRDVIDVAKELALGKALEIARRRPGDIIIASDTIVTIGSRQLEKPVDSDDARNMLINLSQGPSSVITSVAVVQGQKQLVDTDVTNVYFKPDSPEIQAARESYLATQDWKDKAGGYGIQSGAAPLIDHIEGDYDTVVGLPTRLLARMLGEFGIRADAVTEDSPVPQK
jgi:septum formation protein